MDTENTGDSSEDSRSRTPSPVDNLTSDPNFKCVITDVDYTTRITRKRSQSEGLGIDSSSPKSISRTYNIFLTDEENEAEQSTSTAPTSSITSTAPAVASHTQLP